MGSSTARRIGVATAIAGGFDIVAAMLLAGLNDRHVDAMLRGIASGPFAGASKGGFGGAVLGLLVHFAIIAVMAAVYIVAADNLAMLKRSAVLSGIGYGVVTWGVMNLIVLPLRWPTVFPNLEPVAMATQLACHVLLVGLPIALIAARG